MVEAIVSQCEAECEAAECEAECEWLNVQLNLRLM